MAKKTPSYDHKKIEKKWQKIWATKKIYQTKEQSGGKKNKQYVLDMFPYPSGEGLHVGHPKGYIATDVYSRAQRMRGASVLHPMGWDAFGLPAEQYAIKNKIQPAIAVKKNVARFKKQLEILGLDYDWTREINTTDPEYYKWTQWIFLQLYKKGLAYESNEPVNWCPNCKAVLSNEDLEGNACERCGTVVVQRPLRQWVLRITKYADRLLKDLELLPKWPEHIKESQRNWIGRKEGINITYPIDGEESTISVFTTRPDTNFGATFITAAPDGKFVERHISQFPNAQEVQQYCETAAQKTELERISDGRKKTGTFTGWYAINHLTGRKMPIYVGDFVLGNFGTGVVVGVPGHDKRDFEFAQAMDIDVIRVVVGSDGDKSAITQIEQVQEDEGTMINSGFLDDMDIHAATTAIMDHIEKNGWGKRTISYRLQDWVFSRQRYWGEPIPLVHCEKCGIVPVPEKDLPVKLPNVKHYEPTGTGESPLAAIDKWVNVKCPKCKGKAKRETNTMPQWAGSCWYYLRYMDNKNKKAFVDKKKEKYWGPVDMYVGGAEHATRHLIYARFWHKFLYDIKAVSSKEPFMELHSVGLVLAEDGRKMSKRWGNVINPDDVVERFGADTMRLYEMFMGPFENAIAWNTDSMVGTRRFIERAWRLQEKLPEPTKGKIAPAIKVDKNQLAPLHQTIKKVTEDIAAFKFNTAISQMMILMNEWEKRETLSREEYAAFLQLLAPFAPHVTDELWEKLGNKKSIHISGWPKYNAKYLVKSMVTMPIQVNGKMRGTVELPADVDEATAKAEAQKVVEKWLEGKEIKKVIYVPLRMVNIVISAE